MADSKVQNPTSEQRTQTGVQQRGQGSERQGLARRQERWAGDPFYFSPFAMMRRLGEEMDRAFSSSLGLDRRWSGAGRSGAWSPAIEVRERNGQLEIDVELPGMSKEDVKVECTSEGIIFEGEKRSEHESDEGGYHRTERSYGRFYREIPLPEGAAADKATAEFKNGVLQVRVPLAEQRTKGRQIPING
jgi:HSP20 family protein